MARGSGENREVGEAQHQVDRVRAALVFRARKQLSVVVVGFLVTLNLQEGN